MRIFSHTRRRGSVIVFMLMGLIAMLAVGVALLSRAGRESADQQPASGNSVPAPTVSETALSDESTTATAVPPTPTSSPQVIVPPPPPTPVPEINGQSLPPEG